MGHSGKDDTGEPTEKTRQTMEVVHPAGVMHDVLETCWCEDLQAKGANGGRQETDQQGTARAKVVGRNHANHHTTSEGTILDVLRVESVRMKELGHAETPCTRGHQGKDSVDNDPQLHGGAHGRSCS